MCECVSWILLTVLSVCVSRLSVKVCSCWFVVVCVSVSVVCSIVVRLWCFGCYCVDVNFVVPEIHWFEKPPQKKLWDLWSLALSPSGSSVSRVLCRSRPHYFIELTFWLSFPCSFSSAFSFSALLAYLSSRVRLLACCHFSLLCRVFLRVLHSNVC